MIEQQLSVLTSLPFGGRNFILLRSGFLSIHVSHISLCLYLFTNFPTLAAWAELSPCLFSLVTSFVDCQL